MISIKYLKWILVAAICMSNNVSLAKANVGEIIKDAKDALRDVIADDKASTLTNLDKNLMQMTGNNGSSNDDDYKSRNSNNDLVNNKQFLADTHVGVTTTQGVGNNHHNSNVISNSHNTIINNIQTRANAVEDIAKPRSTLAPVFNVGTINLFPTNAPAVSNAPQPDSSVSGQHVTSERTLNSAISNALSSVNQKSDHTSILLNKSEVHLAQQLQVPQHIEEVKPLHETHKSADTQVFLDTSANQNGLNPTANQGQQPTVFQVNDAVVGQKIAEHIKEFNAMKDPTQKFEMYLRPICFATSRITHKQLTRIQMQLNQFVAHTNGKLHECFSANLMLEPSKLTIADLDRVCQSKVAAQSDVHGVYQNFKTCLNNNWNVMIEREIERILVNRINCSKAHKISPGVNGTFNINKLSHDDDEMALLEEIVAQVAESELKRENALPTTTKSPGLSETSINQSQLSENIMTFNAPVEDILVMSTQEAATKAPPHTNTAQQVSIVQESQEHAKTHAPAMIVQHQTSEVTKSPNVVLATEQHLSTTQAPIVVQPLNQIAPGEDKNLSVLNFGDNLTIVSLDLAANNQTSAIKEDVTLQDPGILTQTQTTTTKASPASSYELLSSSISAVKDSTNHTTSKQAVMVKSGHPEILSEQKTSAKPTLVAQDAAVNKAMVVLSNEQRTTKTPVTAIVKDSDTIVLKADSISAALEVAKSGILNSSISDTSMQISGLMKPSTVAPTVKVMAVSIPSTSPPTVVLQKESDKNAPLTVIEVMKPTTKGPTFILETVQHAKSTSAPVIELLAQVTKKASPVVLEVVKSTTKEPTKKAVQTVIEVVNPATTKQPTKPPSAVVEIVKPTTLQPAKSMPTQTVEVVKVKATPTTKTPASPEEKNVIIVEEKLSKRSTTTTSKPVKIVVDDSSQRKSGKAIKDLVRQLQSAHKADEHEHENEAKLHQMEHERQMSIDPVAHLLKHQKYELAKEQKLRKLKLISPSSD